MRAIPKQLLMAIVMLAPSCNQSQRANNAASEDLGSQVPGKGVDRDHKGQPFPNVTFLDASDKPTSLKALQGKPTLVNLWATWCGPCVKELPTLGALSKQGGSDLVIVPIDQEMAPRASVDAFLEKHQLDLPVYRDPKMAVSGAAGAQVLPTTILYDRDGREVWRYIGDLDWTDSEATKLLAEAR
jgi:thiol-disulfide isomerase/thioredoxin